jgi:hypothetical protein
VFFGRQQYNVGLVSLITDLYDYREEWRSGTIARGGEVLRNVCLSVIAGTTPDWLQHMLPQDAFTGGFMSRFILVEQPLTYFKKVTEPHAPDDVTRTQLAEELREVSTYRGQMEWGSGGKEAYAEVYEASLPTGDSQLDAYRERESEQALKVAMQLALSQGKMKLTGDFIRQAWNILKSLRTEVDTRIERLTTHPRMHLVQEVIDLLRMYGELSEEELLRKVYRLLSQGEHQFYETLSILKRSSQIEVIGKPGNYFFRLRRPTNDNKSAENNR